MTHILSALAPLFGLIVIGYLLQARGPLGEAFWGRAEWLTFYILFPSLLAARIGGAETAGSELLPMAGALASATLIVSGAVTLARPALANLGLNGPGFTSVFQGAIRPGTFVGLGRRRHLAGGDTVGRVRGPENPPKTGPTGRYVFDTFSLFFNMLKQFQSGWNHPRRRIC